MTKCGVCKRGYRAAGVRVWVSDGKGLRCVLAYPDCVKLTVRVLIQPPWGFTA